MIRVTPQAIPDVLLVEPARFGDERGWFSETWRRSVLADAGFDKDFVQDNEAFSASPLTMRGLHLQTGADAQAKLVRVVRGAVLDVAVDVRVGSPWYGKAVTAELSAANRRQLLVPEGFAHGYMTLEPDTHALYKVSAYYAPGAEIGLLWSDPALGIDWPALGDKAVVAARDLTWPTLEDFASPFRYEARP